MVDKLPPLLSQGLLSGFKYQAAARLGFLFSNYYLQYWYFEVVEILSRLCMTSYAILIKDMNVRSVVLVLLSMAQTKLQLSLNPFVDEKQNVLAAIGKIQILVVNFLSYVSLNMGLSEVYANGQASRLHRSWYSVSENAVVFLSVFQLGWCVYFIYKSIASKKERSEQLAAEVEEAVQGYFKDGQFISKDSYYLLMSREATMSSILRMQAVLVCSYMDRLMLHHKEKVIDEENETDDEETDVGEEKGGKDCRILPAISLSPRIIRINNGTYYLDKQSFVSKHSNMSAESFRTDLYMSSSILHPTSEVMIVSMIDVEEGELVVWKPTSKPICYRRKIGRK